MGGKTWQQDEEELFWLELIPQSPEGLDSSMRKYSWKEIAEVMHERLGVKSYRNYNHQLIYEHFYQNCKSNHPSPRARGFVRDYMQRRGDKPIERPKESKLKGKTPVKRRTASDDAGSSDVKRARRDSKDTQEPQVTVSSCASPYGYPSLPAPIQGEVSHAASQTIDYDGRTINSYWSPKRMPLPFAPRLLYGSQGQTPFGVAQYSEPPTPNKVEHGASIPNRETFSTASNDNVQQHQDHTLTRPASLPALELRPDFRSNGSRTTLPSINSLTTIADAARPPRLQGLITPKNHGPMFEALLSAASASSAEPSPNSIFSRSASFSHHSRSDSPATTVIDDSGAEAETAGGSDKGKAVVQRAQPQEQQQRVEAQ